MYDINLQFIPFSSFIRQIPLFIFCLTAILAVIPLSAIHMTFILVATLTHVDTERNQLTAGSAPYFFAYPQACAFLGSKSSFKVKLMLLLYSPFRDAPSCVAQLLHRESHHLYRNLSDLIYCA